MEHLKPDQQLDDIKESISENISFNNKLLNLQYQIIYDIERLKELVSSIADKNNQKKDIAYYDKFIKRLKQEIALNEINLLDYYDKYYTVTLLLCMNKKWYYAKTEIGDYWMNNINKMKELCKNMILNNNQSIYEKEEIIKILNEKKDILNNGYIRKGNENLCEKAIAQYDESINQLELIIEKDKELKELTNIINSLLDSFLI